MEEKEQNACISNCQTHRKCLCKVDYHTAQLNNEKIILEHKNELLRQEILELKEREINQTKHYQTMIDKVISQPNESSDFISKQLDIIKDINSNEINNLKADVIERDIKIKELIEKLEDVQILNQELTEKFNELNFKIKEQDLHIKAITEDRDQIESDYNLLIDELKYNSNCSKSPNDSKTIELLSSIQNELTQKSNDKDYACINELEEQIYTRSIQIENMNQLIDKLKAKIK